MKKSALISLALLLVIPLSSLPSYGGKTEGDEKEDIHNTVVHYSDVHINYQTSLTIKDEVSSYKLTKIMEDMPNLTELNIQHNWEMSGKELFIILQKNKKITSLTLHRCGDNIQPFHLPCFLGKNCNIQSIDCNTIEISTDLIERYGEKFIGATLSSSIFTEDLFKRLPNLKFLGVQPQYSQKTYKVKELEGKGFVVMPLQFNEGISKNQIKALNGFIRESKTLKSLDMTNNHMGGHMKKLASAIKDNTMMHTIDLPGNAIDSYGALMLIKNLEGNQTLAKLNLSNNDIGPKSALDIAGWLGQKGNNIQTFKIGNNKIDNKGAELIIAAAKNHEALTYLDLGLNTIDETIEDAIVDNLKDNKVLKMLDLRWNTFSLASQKRIHEALPSIEIKFVP